MSTEHQQHGNDRQQCIQECLNCHSVCLATVAHCLEMGGAHASPQHIGLLLDCAEICQTSANFLLRGSALHARTCEICAEVCEQCAQNCERMGDDAQMRACAAQCHRCAESCRRMATMAA
jgi:hypothetical protein